MSQIPEDSKRQFVTKIGILITITLSFLWLVSDYVAFLLSLLIPALALAAFIISRIAEYLEKSNVPSWYYRLMLVLIGIPLLIGFVFAAIYGFQFSWSHQ